MSGALLTVRGLDAFYGRAQALHGIDMNVADDEVLALIGRNGAGKSTLLKAFMGLVDARADTLDFDGASLQGLAAHRIARRGLGFVPEDRRIFTNLTVAENLEAGRMPARDGREQWNEERVFELFPALSNMASRSARQMSGGEQQMLALARTLMGNPRLLLLDEPSEGLAPVVVDAMAEALQRLKSERIPIILSEQNLRFAGLICDRALVIASGRVTHSGPLGELLGDSALLEDALGL